MTTTKHYADPVVKHEYEYREPLVEEHHYREPVVEHHHYREPVVEHHYREPVVEERHHYAKPVVEKKHYKEPVVFEKVSERYSEPVDVVTTHHYSEPEETVRHHYSEPVATVRHHYSEPVETVRHHYSEPTRVVERTTVRDDAEDEEYYSKALNHKYDDLHDIRPEPSYQEHAVLPAADIPDHHSYYHNVEKAQHWQYPMSYDTIYHKPRHDAERHQHGPSAEKSTYYDAETLKHHAE